MLDVDAIDYGVTQKLIEEISSPIGYVVLNWAFIEQYFSSIIESTFDAASAAGLRPERPRQFEAKKDQLEKSLRA